VAKSKKYGTKEFLNFDDIYENENISQSQKNICKHVQNMFDGNARMEIINTVSDKLFEIINLLDYDRESQICTLVSFLIKYFNELSYGTLSNMDKKITTSDVADVVNDYFNIVSLATSRAILALGNDFIESKCDVCKNKILIRKKDIDNVNICVKCGGKFTLLKKS